MLEKSGAAVHKSLGSYKANQAFCISVGGVTLGSDLSVMDFQVVVQPLTSAEVLGSKFWRDVICI